MIAPGGWRLKDHWERGNSRAALQSRKWDYVVLQDQSTLGVNYYVDGKPRVSSDEAFRPYADAWTAEIRKAGSTPIFYLTWARKATPQDQAALNSAYLRAAKAGEARVAPVGMAWAEARRREPSIELYFPDGSHPSAAGSYLAACTLYAAIFGQSPLGLPATIEGAPVNPENGVPEPAKQAVLVNIDPAKALVLQNAAWNAWKATARPGFFDTAPVASPSVASLPAGVPLGPSLAAGTWKGSCLLYPSSPTGMVLRLEPGPAGWSGHLELQYHSADAADQALDLTDLRVSDREISFTQPGAWQDLTMRFGGVVPCAGVLRGIAEATRADGENPIRLQGTCELRRQ